LTQHIHELVEARELLVTWTMREFRVGYSQSALGAAWAILQPFSLMIIFSVVFSLFLNVPTQNIPYPVFAYCALLPWTFFANGLSSAIPSLVNNFNLVSKIYFPREILPLSALIVSLLDYLIAAIIFGLLILYYRVQVGPLLILLPLVIVIQFMLTFGLSLFASALNVFYRDIRFVVPLVLQLWMYLSPVIYSVEVVPARFRDIYYLNPMAAIIDAYREITLFNRPPNWTYLGIAALTSLIILTLSYRYFKHVEREFADLI